MPQGGQQPNGQADASSMKPTEIHHISFKNCKCDGSVSASATASVGPAGGPGQDGPAGNTADGSMVPPPIPISIPNANGPSASDSGQAAAQIDRNSGLPPGPGPNPDS